MIIMYTFSPKEADSYAKKGELHKWVFDFLNTIGKNKEMANGILKREKDKKLFWFGPIKFPLNKLTRCTGAEKTMEYVEPLKKWENKTTKMVQSIQAGWEPPLLMVNPRPWPILSIRDGNHRYEALKRCGKRKYWIIFWFESPKARNLFIKKYKNIL